jgi:hypothetical protein
MGRLHGSKASSTRRRINSDYDFRRRRPDKTEREVIAFKSHASSSAGQDNEVLNTTQVEPEFTFIQVPLSHVSDS